MLAWGSRRRLLYLGSAAVVLFMLSVWAYLTYFNTPPTCFDGRQNGLEAGVDCGGSCSLLCSDAVHQPNPLWWRAFQVASSTYTAVTYVENSNVGAGARHVHYVFQLLNKDNQLVAERDGVTDLPPVQTIPIVETGIDVGYNKDLHVFFGFSGPIQWNKIFAADLPSLTLGKESLSSDGTRLTATISNDSFVDANKLTVLAVLFDQRDNALAASKSVLNVAAKSSSPVIFTWPQPILGVSHAEITMLPSF